MTKGCRLESANTASHFTCSAIVFKRHNMAKIALCYRGRDAEFA